MSGRKKAADNLSNAANVQGRAAPFADCRIEGAIWGYGAETGVQALRLMLSGALDRFPRIKIVLGHTGEALP